jgi:hypothetical protein
VFNLPCCVFVQQGRGVITMDMIGRIRRLHSRGNKSEREIARITGLSRNTSRSGCTAKSMVRRSTGAAAKAFVPLAFELGEAFQFDWSEEGLVVGGIYYRLQVAHMKLCASRAFWLVAYPSQGHEMLFDAHTRSFAALGGVAAARHLRQHEDGGRQGQEGQGPHRQRALRGDVRALPVRPRLLQRRLAAGRRASSRRTCRTAAGASGGGGASASAASPNSTPGWPTRCRALWQELRHPEQRTVQCGRDAGARART